MDWSGGGVKQVAAGSSGWWGLGATEADTVDGGGVIGLGAAVAMVGMIAGGSSKLAVVFVDGVIWMRLPCWNSN